jgi:hypothetical protein
MVELQSLLLEYYPKLNMSRKLHICHYTTYSGLMCNKKLPISFQKTKYHPDTDILRIHQFWAQL